MLAATLVVGVVFGCAVSLLGVQVARALHPGPSTTVRSCAGAEVRGTLFFAAGSVEVGAQVSVIDQSARKWEVSWGGFASQFPDEPLRPLDGRKLLGATRVLGDTDDGLEREVRVRPADQEAWCTMTLRFDNGIFK